jgi:hypothetical protein
VRPPAAAGALLTPSGPLQRGTEPSGERPGHPPSRRLCAASLRSGGGWVDATGASLVGAKGESPLHRPYLPAASCVPIGIAGCKVAGMGETPEHGRAGAKSVANRRTEASFTLLSDLVA